MPRTEMNIRHLTRSVNTYALAVLILLAYYHGHNVNGKSPGLYAKESDGEQHGSSFHCTRRKFYRLEDGRGTCMLPNCEIESAVQNVTHLYTVPVLYVTLLTWKCQNMLQIKTVLVLMAVIYLVIISNTKG